MDYNEEIAESLRALRKRADETVDHTERLILESKGYVARAKKLRQQMDRAKRKPPGP